MDVLGIDLASKQSAWNLMQADGQVYAQGDSYGINESHFVNRLIDTAVDSDVAAIVIEDLPHRLPFASLVKTVCRMQGRIVQLADDNRVLDRIIFIPPALWQRTFDGVWRGKEVGALAAANKLGYEPPDLLANDPRFELEGLHGKPRAKVRNAAKKSQSDYVDAFLISTWAQNTWAEQATLDVKSTQRYLR
jgi:hypothetical protein